LCGANVQVWSKVAHAFFRLKKKWVETTVSTPKKAQLGKAMLVPQSSKFT